ncbi:MAG: hypothetical protein Q4B32_10010, partial [Clostridia bacterium]|nr:hypothetical protein [Clostridia bacterium]
GSLFFTFVLPMYCTLTFFEDFAEPCYHPLTVQECPDEAGFFPPMAKCVHGIMKLKRRKAHAGI